MTLFARRCLTPWTPDPGLIYLDNAATSFPKPDDVYEFMELVYRYAGVNPGRSGFDLCRIAGDLIDETRELLCRFFGGSDPNRLVFSHNATDALNLALFGLVGRGDHVVTTQLEHNSVIRPLWTLQADEGVELEWIGFDDSGYVDPEAVIDRLRPATKAVVINHGSNVLGTVQDIAPIGRVCRERGVHLVVDASQTAGKTSVRMDELGADVICFTGHKSLMGPMGTGGLYVREGVEIRKTRAGGTGVRSAVRHHLDEYPYRLEFGTHNVIGIAGLNAGIQWVERIGLATIHAHENALWETLRDGLASIDGVVLYGQDSSPESRIAVLSFNVDGFEAADVGTMLDVDSGIGCRTGLHCAPMVHEALATDQSGGAVRLSIGPFNTRTQIETTVEAVKGIAELGRSRT